MIKNRPATATKVYGLSFLAVLLAGIYTAGCSHETSAESKAAVASSGISAPKPPDGRNLEVVRGVLQYEMPCILAGFPNGCLRMWMKSGRLHYINQADRTMGGGFNVVTDEMPGLTFYRLWYNDTDSVLLSHIQPVVMKVQLGPLGTDIISISEVNLAGYLNVP